MTAWQIRRAMCHKRTVSVRPLVCRPPGGEAGLNAWWWVAIGLAAWFVLSLVVGLLLGPFFRHSSQAREALDAQAEQEREEPQ